MERKSTSAHGDMRLPFIKLQTSSRRFNTISLLCSPGTFPFLALLNGFLYGWDRIVADLRSRAVCVAYCLNWIQVKIFCSWYIKRVLSVTLHGLFQYISDKILQ